MTKCDVCGVKVSTSGYLGGGIVCKTCAKAERERDTETIQKRKAKYGGNK